MDLQIAKCVLAFYRILKENNFEYIQKPPHLGGDLFHVLILKSQLIIKGEKKNVVLSKQYDNC